MARKTVEGIQVRHARSCPVKGWEECKCSPTYQANVWSNRDQKRIRKTFKSLAEAKNWRADWQVGLRENRRRAPSPLTVREAGEELIEGMQAGKIRNRSGKVYKPSTRRTYEDSLRKHVYPAFGARKLADVLYPDLQDFVDDLGEEGLDGNTCKNAVMPLRVIYDRYRYQIPVNPTTGLRFPEAGNKPKRIVAPDTTTRKLEALAPSDRAIWATDFYAGLRKGELQALRVEDVQLYPEGRWGLIEVRENMDRYEGVVSTKSSAGKRKVPVPEQLYAILEEHLLGLGRNEGLVFGKTASEPFNYGTLRERTAVAWRKAGIVPERDYLNHDPEIHKADSYLQLHEGRHTYSTFLGAAEIPKDRRDRYRGHATHSMDERYTHQLDVSYLDDAKRLTDFLRRADAPTRLASPALVDDVVEEVRG